MSMENNNEIKLQNCRMNDNGEVKCPIPKSTLDEIAAKKITPSKMVFEVDGS